MNDAEGVFLLYQWIVKNIKIKCYATKKESSTSVFDSGEGDVYGISFLFNKMVSFLNISSGSIEGYTRIYDNKTFIATQPGNWIWNYIIINNTYYLVDVSYGIGGCFRDGKRFVDNMFFLEQNLKFSLIGIFHMKANGNYLVSLFLSINLIIKQL